MLDKKTIVKKIKELDFSPDKYLVVSGACLAIHGIRDAGDIDLVVTPDIFQDLKETGDWQYSKKENPEDGTEFLQYDDIEIASQLNQEGYAVTLKEAKGHQDIIDGIPFMNLTDLINLKQAKGRPKDFADIAMIKEYLAS